MLSLTIRSISEMLTGSPLDREASICDYLWSRDGQCPGNNTDVIIVCENGSVRAHRFLLQSVSPLISELLTNPQLLTTEPLHILAPDFQLEAVVRFLELIYTGETTICKKSDIALIHQFGHKQLKTDLTVTVVLEGTKDFQDQIEDLDAILLPPEIKREMTEVLLNTADSFTDEMDHPVILSYHSISNDNVTNESNSAVAQLPNETDVVTVQASNNLQLVSEAETVRENNSNYRRPSKMVENAVESLENQGNLKDITKLTLQKNDLGEKALALKKIKFGVKKGISRSTINLSKDGKVSKCFSSKEEKERNRQQSVQSSSERHSESAQVIPQKSYTFEQYLGLACFLINNYCGSKDQNGALDFQEVLSRRDIYCGMKKIHEVFEALGILMHNDDSGYQWMGVEAKKLNTHLLQILQEESGVPNDSFNDFNEVLREINIARCGRKFLIRDLSLTDKVNFSLAVLTALDFVVIEGDSGVWKGENIFHLWEQNIAKKYSCLRLKEVRILLDSPVDVKTSNLKKKINDPNGRGIAGVSNVSGNSIKKPASKKRPKKRRVRCKMCQPCLAKPCGECKYCTRPHFKQCCVLRVCEKSVLPSRLFIR